MTLTDNMCQEKKDEEYVPALKTALTHRYNDPKTTYKSVQEDVSHPSQTIQTTQSQQKKTIIKQKCEENNSMGILSD